MLAEVRPRRRIRHEPTLFIPAKLANALRGAFRPLGVALRSHAIAQLRFQLRRIPQRFNKLQRDRR